MSRRGSKHRQTSTLTHIIVNKGGFGFEDAGLNMNYGLYMTMDEQVRGGFETGAGTNYFVSSVNRYNDGQWHYALVTNDGSFVRLYVDGSQIGSRSTSGASPDRLRHTTCKDRG